MYKAVQKKNLGQVYWVLIFITLALFLLLSWYIKQGENNPFASRLRIRVIGSSGSLYIHCFKTKKKLEDDNLLFIVPKPFNNNQTAPAVEYPRTAILVTHGKNAIPYDRFLAPPSTWLILNKSLPGDSLITVPSTWPSPTHLTTMVEIKGITMHYVQTFSEPSEDVYLDYHTIKIVVINSIPSLPDTLKESPFKEKFDVVIINTDSSIPTLMIRELLRPQFIIVLPPIKPAEATESIPNILKPEADDFWYEIYKDSRKALHVKQVYNHK